MLTHTPRTPTLGARLARRPLLRAAAQAAFATLALAAWPLAAQAQQDFSKVEIRAQQLNATTWMLIGAGGNLGLSVGDDAVFLIDDQFAPMAPKIRAAIAKVTPKPVQFLLNTHFHGDHTGGNEAFGSQGTLIVAHDNVRKRMSGDQLISFVGNTSAQKAAPKAALPVVTVPSALSFHINGDEIHAFHVPRAHTDGDLIIHFRKGNVVHMGDVFFNGGYPFIDTSSGGTAEGVLAAYDRVLALADDKTQIIPGHGPLADKAALQRARDMLGDVVQKVKALRAQGQSDEQIRAAKPAAAYDEQWGKGFIKPEQFVQMLLNALPPAVK